MKNKGFTLTEIIVVIGLLAVIGTIIAVNLTNILSKEDENDYNEFVSTVESAACSYIELNDNSNLKASCRSSGCTVEVSNIIKSGLIKADLKNPKTKNLISEESSTVYISWDENQKKCNYSKGS